jgi:hypothetical protein
VDSEQWTVFREQCSGNREQGTGNREKEETPVGQSFKELVVWQRAVQLSLAIYKLTTLFPNA